MTWADFYLVCFLVGFLLTLVSLLLGHLHISLHFPHGDLHMHVGHSGAAHGGSPGSGAHGGNGGTHADAGVSPFNFATAAAFLAWFGGAGYLLTAYYGVWSVLALGLALLFGLAGSALIFWVLKKLVSSEENLDPVDYQMIGVLGRIASAVRESGTGEMVYTQGGTRHAAAVRSEDGSAIARDTEVVVTRYEKGVAYVRRWEELAEGAAAGHDDNQ